MIALYSLFCEGNKMKKIVYFLLFIVIACTVFINDYVQEKNAYLLELNKIGEKNTFACHVFLSSKEDDKEIIYNTLDDALKQYGGNLYCNSVDKDGIYAKNILAYNYTVFEDISLGEGHFFEDKDRSSDKYLTTKKNDDPKCIGRINSFGKDMLFSIRTMKTYFDNSADPLNKSFIICTANNGDYDSIKKQLGANGIIVTEDTSERGEAGETKPIMIIVYITIVILGVITFYDIIMSSKKYAVKKLLGYNNTDLCIGSVAVIALLEAIAFALSAIILSLVLFSEKNSLYSDFILHIIKSYGVVLILTIVLNAVPFVYLRCISISDAVKNRLPIKAISRFNIIIKSVLSIVVIGFSINIIAQIRSYNNLNHSKYDDWEKIHDYAYITNYIISNDSSWTGETDEDYSNFKKLYIELNEKGGIYADFCYFSPLYAKEFKQTEFVPRMSVEVNTNYLKKFPVKDENGDNIEISENETDTIVIVPLKYKDKLDEITEYFSSDFSPTNKTKLIWAENDQEYFTMLVDTAVDNYNRIKDPILYVLTENNAEDYDYQIVAQDNYYIHVDDYKDSQAEINNIFGKYYDLDEVKFVSCSIYEAVEDQIAQNSMMIKIYSVILLLTLIAEIMISIQNITIHIKHYVVHIAVKKILGYGFIDRYSGIYVDSLLSNISVTIVSLVLFRNWLVLLIGIIMIIFDVLLTSVFISYKDSKSILEYTKRG